MNEVGFPPVQQALARMPYIQMLGLGISSENGALTGHLPFADHLIGNPLVPALHGGVIAALLHFTAAAQLMLETQTATLPQVFTATNEYLASPKLKTSHATATLVTRTRRFANLRALAWQEDAAAPIAAASLQFLLG